MGGGVIAAHSTCHPANGDGVNFTVCLCLYTLPLSLPLVCSFLYCKPFISITGQFRQRSLPIVCIPSVTSACVRVSNLGYLPSLNVPCIPRSIYAALPALHCVFTDILCTLIVTSACVHRLECISVLSLSSVFCRQSLYYFRECSEVKMRMSSLLPSVSPQKGRPGMSDVSPVSGISGLSFDSTLLSPLLFFCLVLLLFLSYLLLPAGPFV